MFLMEQLQQTGAASQVFVAGTSGNVKKELPDRLGAPGSVMSARLAYEKIYRGFGPSQDQHSGPIFRTASITLLDALCQIPMLPELLDSNSPKALSATCKSCRLQFIAQVQVVTVMCEENYALILERKWPRLCLVI